YTGTDITTLSSHLFFDDNVKEMAYAEEPFKLIYVVMQSGKMRILTYMKEQEIIGWTRRETVLGTTDHLWRSVASVVERITRIGNTSGVPGDNTVGVDAVYGVSRHNNLGSLGTQRYVERFADRFTGNGLNDAWCVDAALKYTGSPATVFSGLDHLEGVTV